MVNPIERFKWQGSGTLTCMARLFKEHTKLWDTYIHNLGFSYGHFSIESFPDPFTFE